MRRWIRFAASLYPRSWRAEFGEEFRAVLDEVKPSWRVFGNVLRGAIEMRMTNGSGWAKLVAALAIVGAAVGLGVSYRVAPVYVSSATIRVTPVVDPVRPAAAAVLQERVAQHVAEMETELRSRQALASEINDSRLFLYSTEQRTKPLEDVIEKMRRDVRMRTIPGSPDGVVLNISFSYGDPAKARATVDRLVAKFIELNMNGNRWRNDTYKDFWRDIGSVEHVKSVPPAPTGDVASVLTAASAAVKSGPNRFVFFAWGLAAGTLLGLLASSMIRWPRHVRRLAWFGAAGSAAALIVAFQIPNRYTSTGVMQIVTSELTEDPLAAPPAPISASDFLQRTEPRIMSSQSLARIIEDPRLQLYSGERGRPIDDLTRKMRENLRVAALNGGSTFSISFTYPDRFKVQQTVQMMIARFEELNMERQRARMPEMNFRERQITERKAGEVLDVLDIPNLPTAPVFPNRFVILEMGLGLGVLLGAVSLHFWRPGPPQGDARLLQVEVDGAGDRFRAGGMQRGDLQAV